MKRLKMAITLIFTLGCLTSYAAQYPVQNSYLEVTAANSDVVSFSTSSAPGVSGYSFDVLSSNSQTQNIQVTANPINATGTLTLYPNTVQGKFTCEAMVTIPLQMVDAVVTPVAGDYPYAFGIPGCQPANGIIHVASAPNPNPNSLFTLMVQ